jgi:hypothetical protein
MKNPNCDNIHCTKANGEVRLLPTGGDGNMIVCRSCYEHEMAFRRSFSKRGVKPDLPSWESLKVYEG